MRDRMRELSSAPEGHLFELLVPPRAERRGNQEFTAQLAHSPRSEAEGGMPGIRRGEQRKRGTSGRYSASPACLGSAFLASPAYALRQLSASGNNAIGPP